MFCTAGLLRWAGQPHNAQHAPGCRRTAAVQQASLRRVNIRRPTAAPTTPACRRRFPGRTHHVWLEPEGLGTDVVYPNGISNSMEPEDQLRLLQTIPGEPCHLVRGSRRR